MPFWKCVILNHVSNWHCVPFWKMCHPEILDWHCANFVISKLYVKCKVLKHKFLQRDQTKSNAKQLEMFNLEILLIPNALCWSFQDAASWKCNCAWALPAEVQLRLRVTRRSWQKLFAGKNFVKLLVTAQTQLRSYSEQQRAFGNSNICNCLFVFSNERRATSNTISEKTYCFLPSILPSLCSANLKHVSKWHIFSERYTQCQSETCLIKWNGNVLPHHLFFFLFSWLRPIVPSDL